MTQSVGVCTFKKKVALLSNQTLLNSQSSHVYLATDNTTPSPPSVSRVWLCMCVFSPVQGSRTEIRSEAHCLVGLGKDYLPNLLIRGTMREDKMSTLFRKISPYPEKHLRLLLVYIHLMHRGLCSTLEFVYVRCFCLRFYLFIYFELDIYVSGRDKHEPQEKTA